MERIPLSPSLSPPPSPPVRRGDGGDGDLTFTAPRWFLPLERRGVNEILLLPGATPSESLSWLLVACQKKLLISRERRILSNSVFEIRRSLKKFA